MINCRYLYTAVLLANFAFAQSQPAAFTGDDPWKKAVTASDIASLKKMYSTNPPAKSIGADQKAAPDMAPEFDFWTKMFSTGMTGFDVSTVQEKEQQGLQLVSLQIAMKETTPAGPRTRYVTEQQAWQKQGEEWRIVLASHSDVLKMRPAFKPNPNLYNKDANARAEIKEAVERAAKDHQRVILVFGGNWCYDCHVLDQAFHQADVAPLLEKNFQVVHVDIGEDGKKNNDVAADYKVPLNKGVPILAVLDSDGKVLYSQQNGEWESARSMDPDDIVIFLNKWKP